MLRAFRAITLPACRFVTLAESSSTLRGTRVQLRQPHPHTWKWQQLRSAWVDSQGYEHFGRSPRARWGPGPAAVLLGGAGASGFAYYWNCRQEVPYTRRYHSIMMVTENMEVQLGQQAFEQITQEAAATHDLLPPNHRDVQLVKHVGMRIAQANGAGGGYFKHLQNMKWEFAVIDGSEANAMVVPGGKVVVYTRMVDIMSEAELAAVLAHEVGHVVARHTAEELCQRKVANLFNLLLRSWLGISIPGPLVVLGIIRPYSRAAEYEADAIGIHLLAKACYDPDANVTMLQKLAAEERRMEEVAQPASPLARLPLLSTHPLTEERVERVRALLPEAYALRQQYCSHLQEVFGRLSPRRMQPFGQKGGGIINGLLLKAADS